MMEFTIMKNPGNRKMDQLLRSQNQYSVYQALRSCSRSTNSSRWTRLVLDIKKQMLKALLIIAASLLLPGLASAATYYVRID